MVLPCLVLFASHQDINRKPIAHLINVQACAGLPETERTRQRRNDLLASREIPTERRSTIWQRRGCLIPGIQQNSSEGFIHWIVLNDGIRRN